MSCSLLTALGVMMAASGGVAPSGQTWEQAVLGTSPLAFWRFNESSAPFADATGSGNSLSVTGSTTSTRGLYPSTGNAAVWGTTSTRLNPASSAPFRITGDMTLACNLFMTALPASGAGTIIAQCSDSGGGETEATNACFVFSIHNTSGTTSVRFLHEYGAGANEQMDITFPFAHNTAYDIVIVRDTAAKTYSLWVNGEFIGSAAYANNPTGGSTGTLHVGSNVGISGGNSNTTLRGHMDELVIWSRKLSNLEIASIRAGLLYKMDAQTDDFSSDTTSLYTQVSTGSWAVSGGKLIATGGSQCKFLRNGLYSDRISCKMTRADDAGLVLRYQDANNYYLAVICDALSDSINPNKVLLYRKVGGTYTAMGNATISFVRGTENKFDFIAIGAKLIVKHNNVTVLTATDYNLANTGFAGMRNHLSGATSIAEFTEFTWYAVDPLFANVIFMTHMDSANGSDVVVDEVGHSVLSFGVAVVTNVDPKFGVGCTDFNQEPGRYFEVGTADLNMTSGQSFCIEMWRKQGSRTLQENYMECNGTVGTNPSGRWQLYHANSSDTPTFWTSGTSNLLSLSISMPRDGQYHHEAWNREGVVLRGYVDGVLGGTNTSAGVTLNQSYLRWGTFENPTPVDQTYDEIRITKGASRYTAAFARPSIPFPNGAWA